jgi:hypothetical protein
MFALTGCGGGGGLLDKAVPAAMQDILDSPDKVTLYTVATKFDVHGESALTHEAYDGLQVLAEKGGESKAAGEARILGHAELEHSEGAELIDSFRTAVKSGKAGGVKCFMPHHAIRVEKDGRTLDILICFKCHNYMVLPDGGYNNVHMSAETGMEDTWRAIVRKHGLRDVSDKEK